MWAFAHPRQGMLVSEVNKLNWLPKKTILQWEVLCIYRLRLRRFRPRPLCFSLWLPRRPYELQPYRLSRKPVTFSCIGPVADRKPIKYQQGILECTWLPDLWECRWFLTHSKKRSAVMSEISHEDLSLDFYSVETLTWSTRPRVRHRTLEGNRKFCTDTIVAVSGAYSTLPQGWKV